MESKQRNVKRKHHKVPDKRTRERLKLAKLRNELEKKNKEKEELEKPIKHALKKEIKTKQKKEKKSKNKGPVMSHAAIKELMKNPYIIRVYGSKRMLTCSICVPGPTLLNPNDAIRHLNSKVFIYFYILLGKCIFFIAT